MKSTKLILSALAMCFFIVALTPAETKKADNHDIIQIASDTDNLSTLVAAVKAAGLVETLKGDGPFTVFAPTNAAFEKLPEGTVASLLKPENKDQLTRILTYHVVAGKVMSGDLQDGMTAETVEGSSVTVSLGDKVMVDNATVTNADIEAANGVVHLIDTVIMPPEKDDSGY